MDRNQIIGLSLISIILFAWFWLLPPTKTPSTVTTAVDTTALTDKQQIQSSSQAQQNKGGTVNYDEIVNKDSFYTIKTEQLTLVFNHRGGNLSKATLNNFKQTHDTSKPVFFTYSNDWYQLTSLKKSNQDFFFSLVSDERLDSVSRVITFETRSNKQILTHIYTVNTASNTLDWEIVTSDFDYWFADSKVPFHYGATLYPSESSLKYELQMGNISYMNTEDEYDFVRMEADMNETIEEPLQWLSYKQRFFNTTLVASNTQFSKVELKAQTQIVDYDKPFSDIDSRFELAVGAKQSLRLSMYIGDNTYDKLVKLPYNNMYEIIDYGSGMFSFVKYINRGLVLPFFSWISSFIAQMGWAIMLLTIFIRLLTSPLLYSSYLSSAKMRVLRPELTALKEKIGDDKQKYSMEQMSLYRKAGVNPLGGCIPALLQIPIFLALYSFFNSHIQLRGEDFLWATDLSAYDNIYDLPFDIPFYGDHVSLFNITATITSFLISIFGMSMNQSSPEMANNPALKYMPYIFPFFLLFIFNSMPAALTWYYTISNTITLLMQLTINKFIIDQDKILKKIEKNKKKGRGKSNFQQRMEAWQKTRAQK